MIIRTALLGEIECEEQYIIEFPEGLPAFEEEKRFVIIPMADKGPFYYLQAVDNADLCLLLAQPFAFFPDYEVDIPDEDLKKLSSGPEEQELLIYTVMTVPDDFKKATTNLLAPVVINLQTRKGMQYVPVKSSYGTRHFIFQKASQQETASAGAAEGR